MRLLVVTQYFWPEDFRINELVSELVKRGHSVTVLTGKPNYPQGRVFADFERDPTKYSAYDGANIVRVPMVARGSSSARLFLNYLTFAISATVAGIQRFHRERFDAIFVFEPSPVTVGLPAIALRRLNGWPVAFWVLDQWPETLSAVGIFKSKRALGLIARLVSFIYSRCDLMLGQSRSMVSQIAKYCGGRTPVEYFPNWAESAYTAGSAAPAPEVTKREGTFDVMFAGNIGESQDFPSILDAASELRGNGRIRWLIVGDGRMAAWVRDEVARRGLGESFLLLGRVPPERIASFYARADALLVTLKPDPIFSMTVPGKVQSYLASGLPILGMLDGEGARVIEDSRAGYTCAAGQAHQLAMSALKMAALSKTEREAMGANGRAYAANEFNRDALISRLELLLRGIASRSGTFSA